MAQTAAQDIPALQQEIDNLKQEIAQAKRKIEDVKQQIDAARGSALPCEEQLAGLQRQLDRSEELELTLQRRLDRSEERVFRQEAAGESSCRVGAQLPRLNHHTLPVASCPPTQVLRGGAARRAAASLESGELYNVLMEKDGKQLPAELLVDTGCNIVLNISDYKADQLGLPLEGDCARVEMGQGNTGTVQRRGAVLTTVLLEGEGDEIIKDPHRSRYLEVWTDAGTGGGTSGGDSSSGGGSKKSDDVSGAASVLTIKVLSPIKKGCDSCGHDAILGAPGMALLGLGIDRETMRLYRKQSSSFRKL